MLSKNLKEEVILHLNGQLIRSLKLINKYKELYVLLSKIMSEELLIIMKLFLKL